MIAYHEFLASKRPTLDAAGLQVPLSAISPLLFGWQREIVRWALARARAALFEACGLGKSFQEFEWARLVSNHTGKPVLILTPLAVARQMHTEGIKLGVPVTVCRHQSDVQPGVNVTNYEMLEHFDAEAFGGLVIDESSCLKSFGGIVRKQITEFGRGINYRLAATATPAPNDLVELTNHAEFLGIMSGKEIIALFFTQDGNTTHAWRLKGHARQDFWRWMATWCVALRAPSDLGYEDGNFTLPPLRVHQHVVDAKAGFGTLFAIEAQTLQERQRARSASTNERVDAAAELVRSTPGQWICWCDLNKESEALAHAIPDAREVRGSDTVAYKEQAVIDFLAGRVRVLVSKPSIFGWGLNLQVCHQMTFVGLSDSFEALYQATRRCWRFGQTKPVDVHIIISEAEGAVQRNIERKERQAQEMMDELVGHMAGLQLDSATRTEMDYREAHVAGTDWDMYLGDSVKTIDQLADASVGLVITSPPFPGMYAYSNSAHDIGNTTTVDEMIEHFRYLIGMDKLGRVVMPGRMACIHLMQLTAMKSREGYIGLHDYRGRVIQMMIDAGWVYAGEVTIEKNPQIQAVRNKERGLLFKTLATDSSLMRMALADYLLYFRKPGDNPAPIQAGKSPRYNPDGGWITEQEWIEWASPVWYRQRAGYPGGIRETDVLNVAQAKDTDDERHLCPLQIGVIERAVKLWSAPGDLVLDPFAGIGSTLYEALRLNRRAVGLELKDSYFRTAIQHCQRAIAERNQATLFDPTPGTSAPAPLLTEAM